MENKNLSTLRIIVLVTSISCPVVLLGAQVKAEEQAHEVLYHALQAHNIAHAITSMIGSEQEKVQARIATLSEHEQIIPANEFACAAIKAIQEVVSRKPTQDRNVRIDEELELLAQQLSGWSTQAIHDVQSQLEWITQRRQWEKKAQLLQQELRANSIRISQETQDTIEHTFRQMLDSTNECCQQACDLLKQASFRSSEQGTFCANISFPSLPEIALNELTVAELTPLVSEQFEHMIKQLEWCDSSLTQKETQCVQYMMSKLNLLVDSNYMQKEPLAEKLLHMQEWLATYMADEHTRIMQQYDEGCLKLHTAMQQKVEELKSHISGLVGDLTEEIECYEADSCRCAVEYFVGCAERIRDACASIYLQVHGQMNDMIAQVDEMDNQARNISCNIVTPLTVILSDFKAQQTVLKNNIVTALEALKDGLSDRLFARVDLATHEFTASHYTHQLCIQEKQVDLQNHLNKRLNETLYALAAYQQHADVSLNVLQAELLQYLTQQLSGMLDANALVDKKIADAVNEMYAELEANFSQMLASQLCMKRKQYGQLCEKLSMMQANVIKRVDTLSVIFDGLMADLINQAQRALENINDYAVKAIKGVLTVLNVVMKYTLGIIDVVSALTELGLLISENPMLYILYCIF